MLKLWKVYEYWPGYSTLEVNFKTGQEAINWVLGELKLPEIQRRNLSYRIRKVKS